MGIIGLDFNLLDLKKETVSAKLNLALTQSLIRFTLISQKSLLSKKLNTLLS